MSTLYLMLGLSFAFLLLLYAILIGVYLFALRKAQSFKTGTNPASILISVLLPFRNESLSIVKTLESLYQQDYPFENWELILVDDHSTDDGLRITQKFLAEHPDFPATIFEQMVVHSERSGKKMALKTAMENSRHPLVITTDADTQRGPQWLSTLGAYFEKERPAMILAPVHLAPVNSIFAGIQAIEFISLMGTTAASALLKSPILANGANLGYTRAAFESIGELENEQFASGDDIFALLKFKSDFPGKIHFVFSELATVTTAPVQNLSGFFQQRIRWASKAKAYRDFHLIASGWIVLMINLSIVSLFVGSLFNQDLLSILVPLFAGKLLVDFFFLQNVTSLFKKSKLLLHFIPAQLLYPFYFTAIGLAALGGKYRWKGRTLH